MIRRHLAEAQRRVARATESFATARAARALQGDTTVTRVAYDRALHELKNAEQYRDVAAYLAHLEVEKNGRYAR